ncbi:hypothetical protein [Muricoccus pecuniae]|uniref:Uncharacterized protein n=1 Tax=Muricoccus pecuniae TaxID=693023 RepID=A0A840Y4J6_9PROT|nr:hypothetical protein [Roseomonas pecuniae]MBB5696048.1 hypothetical protein [Roseomonas pecuniae]
MAIAEPKEVKTARAKVRAKEAGAWDKVEAAGRTARQAEGAQASKATTKASSDDTDEKAKKRQGMTA